LRFDVYRGIYFRDNLDYNNQSTKSNPKQSNTRTTPVVPSKKKVTKKKDMLKVYPGPTLALNAINAKIMVMWRKFIPANPKPSIWGTTRSGKGRHKEIVYLGN